jgi:uncharacterized membrane protein YhdT
MPPGNLSSHLQLEELSERVKELERRLSRLEHSSPVPSHDGELRAAPGPEGFAPTDALAAQLSPSVLSVFGRAVLGIAGAYVLRAAAESGAVPSSLAVTLALLYAAAWLVWAARTRVQGGLTRHSYAITAALILAPMLWEATIRFRMLAPSASAAVLAVFALLAVTLSWPSTRGIVWIGMLTAILTAAVLMVATRVFVPFTLSLLAMALLSELATIRGKWTGLRPVAAAAADFAVLILVLILGNSATVPPDYGAVGTSLMLALVATLFAIYAVSISIRSLILQRSVTVFEGAQLAVVCLLTSWSVLRITSGAGRFALGILFLVVGAACYFVSFGVLSRHRERPNFHFYAVCGVVLVMAGSFFALAPVPLVIWLCLAAVTATGLGVHARNPELDSHGVAYLSGAVVTSGLLQYAGRALAGPYPPDPGALPIAAAAAALVCTGTVSRYPGEHLGERILRSMPAILAVYATAALAVTALVGLVARGEAPTPPQLAVVRTIVTCAVALLLAFAGARWKRIELVWMAYAAVVLGSLKLAFEDMRFGTTQSFAVSLLIYGAVLILIPRLTRAGKRLA